LWGKVALCGFGEDLSRYSNKDQPSLTDPRDALRCITANVLQTNKVDAQSDKLATELS